MNFSGAQLFAVNRAKSRCKVLLQRFRSFGRNHASRVQRTAEAVRRPPTAKRFEITEHDGLIAGNFAPGI